MLLVNHSALSGLKNAKVPIFTRETKNVEDHRKTIEDSELQASLDEDDAQTQQRLVYRLSCFMIVHHRTHYLIITYLHRWDTHLVSTPSPSYENVRKWLSNWFAWKEEQFYGGEIDKLSEKWENCIATDGAILRIRYFREIFKRKIIKIIFKIINVYFLYKNSGFIYTYLVYTT